MGSCQSALTMMEYSNSKLSTFLSNTQNIYKQGCKNTRFKPAHKNTIYNIMQLIVLCSLENDEVDFVTLLEKDKFTSNCVHFLNPVNETILLF